MASHDKRLKMNVVVTFLVTQPQTVTLTVIWFSAQKAKEKK